MKGRKPTTLKLVAPSQRTAHPPAAPRWMGKEAQREWARVVPDLHGRGLLATADLAAVEQYCVAAAAVREMAAVLSKEGSIITDSRGMRTHPAYQMQMTAIATARRLATELGLSPTARARPGMSSAGGGSDANAWGDLGVG